MFLLVLVLIIFSVHVFVANCHCKILYFIFLGKQYDNALLLFDIQVVVLLIVPRLKESSLLDAKDLLMIIILFQYVPRLIRIIPLYMEVTRSAGIITETAWAGAAFNLLLYMLASHVSSLFSILLSSVIF